MGVLAKLEAVVEELCGTDSSALCDAEAVVVLHRCLNRLEAVTTRAAAAFEASGTYRSDGAHHASAWLATKCHLPRAGARRRLWLGRGLRHLPLSERAWLAGDVGSAQVAALVAARTPATAATLAGDEAMLLAQAKKFPHEQFTRLLAYWVQKADPEGTEKSAADQLAARRWHYSQTFGGSWVGELLLDPLNGAVVANQLKAIEAELFEADWAEARQRLGEDREPNVLDLARTPAQRRADAVVEMARRAGSTKPGDRRPEPLFTVLVDYESFGGRICELANGTVVAPGALVSWLDAAWVERVVFDSPSRVIDVGVAQRLPPRTPTTTTASGAAVRVGELVGYPTPRASCFNARSAARAAATVSDLMGSTRGFSIRTV